MSDLLPPALRGQAPSAAPAGTTGPKTYAIGTLRYSLRGVTVLFLWLLWGDFAFTFFENIFGRFIPFFLKDLNASNTLIGVMTGSFAGLVNIFFLPNFSQWSDRTRSRLGRRLPFLYVVAPLTAASLLAVGFAPEIAGWCHDHLLGRLAPGLSKATLVLGFLCTAVVSFHLFNMALVNSYNWLLRDVVPIELMARFLSWFRVVGTLGAFVFLWWVFPHLMDHREAVFLGVSFFYVTAFFLMCRNVKEGEYPPPDAPAHEGAPLRNIARNFALYFRQCLALPIYRNYFIAQMLVVIATSCSGPFTSLFVRDSLGVDMDDMGKIFAWGMAASSLIYFPMGWLCDRYNPLIVALVSLVGMAAGAFLALLLIHGRTSYLVYTLAWALPSVGWALAAFATTMKLFPEEKFGQFSSGLNVFGCGAIIFGNYLMGAFMDLVRSDYRMAFLWVAVCYALAIYPLLLVHRDWKRHGGPDRYVAPLPPD